MNNNERTAERRLRIAELIVGLLIVALLLAVLISSHTTANTDRDTMREIARAEVVGAVEHMTYVGGDTYEITFTGDVTEDLSFAATRGLLSTVSVWASFDTRDDATFTGAGVIFRIDKDRGEAYILTNYHVIYYEEASAANRLSRDIQVYLYGKELEQYAINAYFVGGSPTYDLAVLKVSGSDLLRTSNATAAVFANSNDVSVLDTVIAIGNPASGGISATVGHINVESETIVMPKVTDFNTNVEMRVMRVDAAVNGGNSGGGLFNARGEVIGIVNAKMADSDIENIGFAIPSNIAGSIAENILYYCDGTDKESVYRCKLGVQVKVNASAATVDVDTGKVRLVEEVVVENITAGSLADGVLQTNDILLSLRIGDTEIPITRTFHIVDAMLNVRVGDTVSLTVQRGIAQQTLTIEITEQSLAEY